ncbi:MAG: DUF2059 domain-containing protein, partial [Thalassovita sp.]
YDLSVLRRGVAEVFQQTMNPALSPQAVGFFESALGQRFVEAELVARRAFVDPKVEDAARLAVDDLPQDRKDALTTFIAVNELVDYNVVGGMTAQVRFYQGMAQGGLLKMTDQEILSDAWAAEEELRRDTQKWLMAYLMLSFEEMSNQDIAAYTAFSRTAPGRAVNQAIFQAYDRMYSDLSLALGLAIADMALAEEL